MALKIPDPFYQNALAVIAALFVQLLLSLFVQDTLVITRTYIFLGMFFGIATGIEMVHRRRLRDSSSSEGPGP